MEDKASQVLSSTKYSTATKQWAGSVLSQSKALMNEQKLSNQFLLFFPGFSSTSLIPFPATLTHHLPEKRQLVANIPCLGRWTPLKRLFEVTLPQIRFNAARNGKR
ncbi:hypothetical protein AMC82_PC00073 (plasmid) [Rhizobium phaseoli]|uniref:hypothetical protein n=1 Tax=Rhizobium phaseoli TaxID=396 RepID=UPI0007F174AF|nr:hypothetical protein [Rhizobium phaseoli]ANL68637.1 hypothetical protein AMC84_PC00073 [Rhizobium phaseoli]ANL81446.1 hypothetical protein AMC82_PC00073 [Rhizobium phaseoli]